MAPLRHFLVVMLLLASLAVRGHAQTAALVIEESFEVGMAVRDRCFASLCSKHPPAQPSPATVTALDINGDVIDQREVPANPADISAAVDSLLGSPSSSPSVCPPICAAALACREAIQRLCSASNGALCLTQSTCPSPSICSNCS